MGGGEHGRCSPSSTSGPGWRRADQVVAGRRRLPDLSAQLRRRRRRRDRRPARHHRPPRPPRGARRRRGVAVADLPLAAGRQRLRHQRLPRHRPDVRHARRPRRAARRPARPGHQARHGPRRQPHVRRAPVVRRVPASTRPTPSGTGTGGVRPAPAWTPGRRAPSRQLGVVLLGLGLGARPGDRRVLPAPVLPQVSPTSTGRSPAVRAGRLRDDALVARPRGRRVPDGRHQPHLQGPRTARRTGARRRAVRRRLPVVRLSARASTSSCRRCTGRCSPDARRSR